MNCVLLLIGLLLPALAQDPVPPEVQDAGEVQEPGQPQEPSEIVAGAWRFEKSEDNNWRLLHADQVVLGELAMDRNGTPIPFRPQRISAREQDDGSLELKLERGRLVRLHGVFRLSEKALPLHFDAPATLFQLGIDKAYTRRCNALLAPDLDLALTLPPASLDLDFWAEGGPAAVSIKLDQSTILGLRPWSQAASTALADFQGWMQSNFSDEKSPLPAELQQAFVQDHGRAKQRRVLTVGARAWQQLEVVNLRLGGLPGQPAYDVLWLHNPGTTPRHLELDMAQDLGWENTKRKRTAVRFPDGVCLGVFSERITADLPPGGHQLLVVRATVPRGVVASAAGPLAPRLWPWMWDSLEGSASGVAKFGEEFIALPHPHPDPWVVFATDDRQGAPLRVQSVHDEEGEELSFEQGASWIRLLRLPRGQDQTWKLKLKYGGRMQN